MTRKDYILIAEAVKRANDNWTGFAPEAGLAIEGLAKSLSTQLAIDNPRFNRALFLEACGVK
jgi:DNA-binding phage protein